MEQCVLIHIDTQDAVMSNVAVSVCARGGGVLLYNDRLVPIEHDGLLQLELVIYQDNTLI